MALLWILMVFPVLFVRFVECSDSAYVNMVSNTDLANGISPDKAAKLGKITFTVDGDQILVQGTLSGLKTQGDHGFHVHAKGEIVGGCVKAGGHFNPFNKTHGGPDAAIRHVGDLGNINADSKGISIVNKTDSVIKLSGENSIIGLALVVHADPDDLGLGNYTDSKITGHAGARLGCGVIYANSTRSTKFFGSVWILLGCLVTMLKMGY